MKVHPSHTDELAPAAAHARAPRGAAATAVTRSFASVHESALAGDPGTDVPTPTPTGRHGGATVPGVEVKPIKLRKGEAMAPVAGHAYGEITAGGRDGMYVNTTNNARRGQAFVLVHKHGREYHIYGTGKDRVVVALKARKAPAPPATTPSTTPPIVAPTGANGATRAPSS
jgi:hypothetical protein